MTSRTLGATVLLMPLSCRRDLFDISDDMATTSDIHFYSDAREALLKACTESTRGSERSHHDEPVTDAV